MSSLVFVSLDTVPKVRTLNVETFMCFFGLSKPAGEMLAFAPAPQATSVISLPEGFEDATSSTAIEAFALAGALTLVLCIVVIIKDFLMPNNLVVGTPTR